MKRTWKSQALLASVLAVTPVPLMAQAQRTAARPAAAAPSVSDAAETFPNLGDRRLMGELADRGLDSLLDRYFDLHKTPEAEQKAIKSTGALRDLANPKLSNSEKEKKVKQIVAAINTLLPNMKDPFKLASDGGLLMLYGVTRDANLLEYWGENPATQARLLPTAQAVYDILGKAGKEATAQAGILAGKMNSSNQNQLGPQWDKLDQLSHTAEYSQQMMAYYLALAMPKADRARVVDKALKYLEELDNADSTVMPRVHVMMGKLNLVAGKNEDAMKYLDAVANQDPSIQPKPEPAQVYEAKYFSNVAKLQAGKIADAKKGLEDLITWEKTNMPTDSETQKGIAAAAEMLRYRIFLGEADQTKDPLKKKDAEANATQVLLKLSKDRPELRGIIYQQLVERMPKDAPVKTMDPLLLQGLMAKGYGEASKPEGSALDQTVLDRGLAAAQEVASRPVSETLTPQLKDEAGRLIPVLLEAMKKKVEAAAAYLKYAQENTTLHLAYAQGALDDAGRLVFDLRKTDPQDPQVSDLYDRFLPVAINPPFNKVQLAYYYGQRLVAAGKPQDAVKYFKMVAKADRNYNSAQYAMLRATQDLLSAPKLTAEQRTLLATELMHQAESVRQTYANATDPVSRERAAIATLVAAETAGADLKKPNDTIELLAGFEDTIKGVPDEKPLLTSALLDRVNANMALNKIQPATDMLVTLLNTTGGAQGAELVRGLLDKLDKDLDKAQASNDTNTARDIAASEAKLSVFLVQWAETNKNPEIKKYTYQYKVFDARTKRLAGALATDPAEKQRLLNGALAAYHALEQPDNVALFQQTLDQAKVKSGDIDPKQPDPNVRLGIALTDFELKNYKEAAEILGDLLNNGKLGGATLLVTDPTSGEQKVTDNDTYWEATYKLYASNVGEAKNADDPSLAGTKQGLKNILVRGGIPAKWQDKFEDLRKQIVPDFNVAALMNGPTSQPAAGATTQPVSAR